MLYSKFQNSVDAKSGGYSNVLSSPKNRTRGFSLFRVVRHGGLVCGLLWAIQPSVCFGSTGISGDSVVTTNALEKVDLAWVMICALLIFAMQAGFMCVEAGLSRAKNSIHVAFKNVADMAFAVIAYWLFGFGLMFGSSYYGLFGTSMFCPSGSGDYWLAAFFVFQAMLCATVSTIDSGAVAERACLRGYTVTSKIVCALIYPVVGHWVWAGLFIDGQAGWLESLGFTDCAGATVVHSTGGWVALAGIMVVGPRLGKFENGVPQRLRGHNIPLMFLGMFMLFFGWFGINCGSTLAVTDATAAIAMNTLIGGCFAGAASGAMGIVFCGRPDPKEVASGTLGGLVAVAAGCHLLEPIGSAALGVGAAIVVFAGSRFVERRMRLDDVVGAVAVHGFCGVWGTIGFAMFIPLNRLPVGMTRVHLLGVQSLGVVACFVWSFGLAYACFKVLNRIFSLRVSEEAERLGLNIAEHNASSGFLELQQSLATLIEDEFQSEDLEALKVEPEVGTEIGDLAVAFNCMIDALQADREELFASSEREELLEQLVVASREAGMAEIAVGMLHNVGNALNSLTVSTGVMRHSIQSSSFSRLKAANLVLASHRDDLAEFLTTDAKGQHFLSFLGTVCDRLELESKSLDRELEAMALSVENLKGIVSKQEEYAHLGGGTVAQELLPDLVEEAKKMLHLGLERDGVTLRCEYNAVSPVMQDKRVILQVLTHLLRNATHAVVEHEGGLRTIRVRVWEESNMVCCSVEDPGVGIPEQNIDAIFGHGFSTRRERGGRGFGLHSSANSIQQMGGTISAFSDGPGRGSRFTIRIPAWKDESDTVCLTAKSIEAHQATHDVPCPHGSRPAGIVGKSI